MSEAPAQAAPRCDAHFDAIVRLGPEALATVGGLTLFERAAFVLARAGAARLLVLGPRPSAPLRLPPLPVTWAGRAEDAAQWAAGGAPVAIGTTTAGIFDVAAVRALVTAPGPASLAARAALLVRGWPIEVTDVLQATTASPPAGARPWTPPPDALLLPAAEPAARAAAEDALYARLGRGGDGWFTRLVDRRLSRALTRRLVPTGIAPNTITLGSIAIGITGGLLLATGGHAAAVTGACLFLASTLLDGCDGEIARLTFRETPLGARLDVVGDNVVHLVLFGGIALGLYRRTDAGAIAALGIVLVVGVLLAMVVVWACLVRREPTPRQQALFEAFASREFAYLLVGLALVDRLLWFLWIAALGTYAFVIALLVLGRRPSAAPG